MVHCPQEWVDIYKNEYMDFYNDRTSMKPSHPKKVMSSDNCACPDAC